MAYQSKKYRKFVATAATATLVATAVAPAAGFAAEKVDLKDVKGHWAEDAINYLIEKGAVNGYEDGTFKPNGSITRAEVATILAKTLGLEIDEDAKTELKDAKDHWASSAIAAIQKAKPGVINGFPDGTFKPEQNIARQDMAKMVVAAFPELKLDESAIISFTDKADYTEAQNAINVLASLGIVTGKGDNKFDPKANVTRAETATFVHRTEVPAERLPVETTEAKVVSVSAINGGQLLVTFNREVDTTTGEDEANYTVTGNVVDDASLQADGKSVLLTLDTAYDYRVTSNIAVTVEDVKVAKTVDTLFPVFTTLVTVADTTKAEIKSVTAKTNGEYAESLTIVFTEPVKAGSYVKVNGTQESVTTDSNRLTVTGLELNADEKHLVEIVNLEDRAGNVNALVAKQFDVTVDTVVPTVSVAAHGDNHLLLTFSKDMATSSSLATVISEIEGAIAVYDETLTTVGNLTVSQYEAGNYTQFLVSLDDITASFFSSKTTRDLTIRFDAEEVTDTLGNYLAGSTKTTKISKDTVVPSISAVTFEKNSDGEVTNLVVTASEAISAADYTKIVAVNSNGVLVTDLFSGAAVVTGKTVKVPVKSGVKAGTYNLSFGPGFLKDEALTTNSSKSYSTQVNFGTSSSTSTFTLVDTVASNNVTEANNEITIVYPEAVKGGAVSGSATDAKNYTLNGKALPEGTTLVFSDTDQDTLVIKLPKNSIAKTDTSAVFTINNVQSLTGKTIKPFTTTVSVEDNVDPELTAAELTSYDAGSKEATFVLTFNEAMDTLSGTEDLADELVFFNGTSVLTGLTVTGTRVTGFNNKVVISVTDITLDTKKSISVQTTTAGTVDLADLEGNEIKGDIKVTVKK